MDMHPVVDFLKHSLIVKGAVTGTVAAARVDFKAFREAQDRGETGVFVDHFDFTIARKRWISGAIMGALTGGGFEGLAGLF